MAVDLYLQYHSPDGYDVEHVLAGAGVHELLEDLSRYPTTRVLWERAHTWLERGAPTVDRRCADGERKHLCGAALFRSNNVPHMEAYPAGVRVFRASVCCTLRQCRAIVSSLASVLSVSEGVVGVRLFRRPHPKKLVDLPAYQMAVEFWSQPGIHSIEREIALSPELHEALDSIEARLFERWPTQRTRPEPAPITVRDVWDVNTAPSS